MIVTPPTGRHARDRSGRAAHPCPSDRRGATMRHRPATPARLDSVTSFRIAKASGVSASSPGPGGRPVARSELDREAPGDRTEVPPLIAWAPRPAPGVHRRLRRRCAQLAGSIPRAEPDRDCTPSVGPLDRSPGPWTGSDAGWLQGTGDRASRRARVRRVPRWFSTDRCRSIGHWPGPRKRSLNS
jgi:hypothetical protein